MKNSIMRLARLVVRKKKISIIVALALVLAAGNVAFVNGTGIESDKETSEKVAVEEVKVREAKEPDIEVPTDETLEVQPSSGEETAETAAAEELTEKPSEKPKKAEAKSKAKEAKSETVVLEVKGKSSKPEAAAAVSKIVNTKPYFIRVNKQTNCVTVYGLDNNNEYTIPIKAMACSTGSRTPMGTFKTTDKYAWRKLEGDVWGQYATRITGTFLFHSVPYKYKSKDSLIGDYYNKLGTSASAGCVRLTVADTKWIYDNCPKGTQIEIYSGPDQGPLGKPSTAKVGSGLTWDPTDPDSANAWRNGSASIKGAVNRTIERGTSINLTEGVTAADRIGNDITEALTVTGNVDINTVGNYSIAYSVNDSTGSTVSIPVTFMVKDTTAPSIAGNGAAKVIPLNQSVDTGYALSRVAATDSGSEIAATVSIGGKEWGYSLDYAATDASGNRGTYREEITYETCSLSVSANGATVMNMGDDSQLKAAAAATARFTVSGSRQLSADDITVVDRVDNGNGTCNVTFGYAYSCPLGSRTATATCTITMVP